MKAIEWSASDTRYARCNKCQDRPGKDGLGRPCKTCKGTGWLHGPGLSARWCPLCGTQHAVTKGEPSPWPNVTREQIETAEVMAVQIAALKSALTECLPFVISGNRTITEMHTRQSAEVIARRALTK